VAAGPSEGSRVYYLVNIHQRDAHTMTDAEAKDAPPSAAHAAHTAQAQARAPSLSGDSGLEDESGRELGRSLRYWTMKARVDMTSALRQQLLVSAARNAKAGKSKTLVPFADLDWTGTPPQVLGVDTDTDSNDLMLGNLLREAFDKRLVNVHVELCSEHESWDDAEEEEEQEDAEKEDSDSDDKGETSTRRSGASSVSPAVPEQHSTSSKLDKQCKDCAIALNWADPVEEDDEA
jgi:hypothetical protein